MCQKALSLSPIQILQSIYTKCPRANIGIAAGRVSGWDFLDVDGADGEQALAAYAAFHAGYDMAVMHRHGTGSPEQLCPYELETDGSRLWLRGYATCKEQA